MSGRTCANASVETYQGSLAPNWPSRGVLLWPYDSGLLTCPKVVSSGLLSICWNQVGWLRTLNASMRSCNLSREPSLKSLERFVSSWLVPALGTAAVQG